MSLASSEQLSTYKEINSLQYCLVPCAGARSLKNEPCRDKTSTVKLITVVKCDNDACSSIHGFRASDIDC